MKILSLAVAALVVVFGLSWIVQGNDWFMYNTFAPKYEQTCRNTFVQSQAYNEGMVRDLENIKMEYDHTDDPSAKMGLKSTFLHRVDGYPNKEELPLDLRNFYYSISK